MMVVHGKAMIMPTIPIKAPQIDNDKSMMAGFSPVIFPMTFGTMIASCMTCTTQKTIKALINIHQKLVPVSAAFSRASSTVGTKAINCK